MMRLFFFFGWRCRLSVASFFLSDEYILKMRPVVREKKILCVTQKVVFPSHYYTFSLSRARARALHVVWMEWRSTRGYWIGSFLSYRDCIGAIIIIIAILRKNSHLDYYILYRRVYRKGRYNNRFHCHRIPLEGNQARFNIFFCEHCVGYCCLLLRVIFLFFTFLFIVTHVKIYPQLI